MAISLHSTLILWPRIDQQVNELAKCKWFSTLDLKSAYYQVPLATEDRAYTAFESWISIAAYSSVSPMVSRVSRELSITLSLITKQTFAYLDNITIGGFDKLIMIQVWRRVENNLFQWRESVVAVTEIDILGYRIYQGSGRVWNLVRFWKG